MFYNSTKLLVVGSLLAGGLLVAASLVTAQEAAVRPAVPRNRQQKTAKDPASELHTISASVEYSTTRLTSRSLPTSGSPAGIQAERQVGEFVIKEGLIAQDIKYSFWDPATGFKSETIHKGNIYSVTQRRYVGDEETLLPGKYRFVMGGFPGSQGNLTYTTVPDPEAGWNEADAQPPTSLPPARPKATPRDRTKVRQPPTRDTPPPVNAEGKKWCPYCKTYH